MGDDEKRVHARLVEEDSVVVTIISIPGAPTLQNRTIFCTTADVSAGGVRLHTDTGVPGGAVVELRVAISNPLRAFKQRGRVAWVTQLEGEDRYALGIEFLDRASSGMIQWKDMVRRRLKQSGEPA